MTRILLADDHPLTISGIEALLTGTDYKVVHKAATGGEVLDALPTARPDILVLDVDMPDRTGLDVLRTLRSRGDKRPVVLLTGSINDGLAIQAIQAGVSGLVMKATAPAILLQCLEAVRSGRRWIDHDLLQRALERTLSDDWQEKDPLHALSGRERAVAGLVRQGLRNKDIASELGVTEGTVKVHLHKIYEKLGIGSRTELVILAQDAEKD
jgi:two-component system nitrate/nitrite response regulator NarL